MSAYKDVANFSVRHSTKQLNTVVQLSTFGAPYADTALHSAYLVFFPHFFDGKLLGPIASNNEINIWKASTYRWNDLHIVGTTDRTAHTDEHEGKQGNAYINHQINALAIYQTTENYNVDPYHHPHTHTHTPNTRHPSLQKASSNKAFTLVWVWRR